MLSPSLSLFLDRMPLYDLHVHYKGALNLTHLFQSMYQRGQTIAEIGAFGVDKDILDFLEQENIIFVREGKDFWLPKPRNQKELLHWWKFANLLRQDLQVIRFIEDGATLLYNQGVKGLELRFGINSMLEKVPLPRFFSWIQEGFQKAKQAAPGMELIGGFSLNRKYHHSPRYYTKLLRFLKEHDRSFIRYIDVSGPEWHSISHLFDPLKQIKDLGYGITLHVGETNVGSIYEALQLGIADRFSHCLYVKEDLSLLKKIREAGVFVECCLTSNWYINELKKIEDHPSKYFQNEGIPFGYFTDNPTIYRTSPRREIELALSAGLIKPEYLPELQRDTLKASFFDEPTKERLSREFSQFLSRNNLFAQLSLLSEMRSEKPLNAL